MPKEYKFYLKILTLPILCFSLGKLNLDKVSSLGDFMKGFGMAVLIIIILWEVYSLIRSLKEI